MDQHPLKQFDHRVARNQALAIFGEHGGHPYGTVDGLAAKPAKEPVVLGLLRELAH